MGRAGGWGEVGVQFMDQVQKREKIREKLREKGFTRGEERFCGKRLQWALV
jgi:hypothetical protein